MSDKTDVELEALFAAARPAVDTSRLEWGFETRVQARLREERGVSLFTWAWRLCPYFAVLAIAAGLWSRTTTARVQSEAQLLSDVTRSGEARMLFSYMTGDKPE